MLPIPIATNAALRKRPHSVSLPHATQTAHRSTGFSRPAPGRLPVCGQDAAHPPPDHGGQVLFPVAAPALRQVAVVVDHQRGVFGQPLVV